MIDLKSKYEANYPPCTRARTRTARSCTRRWRPRWWRRGPAATACSSDRGRTPERMREERAAVLIRHAALEGTNTSAAEAEFFGHFGSISGSRHRRAATRRDAEPSSQSFSEWCKKTGAAPKEERGVEKREVEPLPFHPSPQTPLRSGGLFHARRHRGRQMTPQPPTLVT